MLLVRDISALTRLTPEPVDSPRLKLFQADFLRWGFIVKRQSEWVRIVLVRSCGKLSLLVVDVPSLRIESSLRTRHGIGSVRVRFSLKMIVADADSGCGAR